MNEPSPRIRVPRSYLETAAFNAGQALGIYRNPAEQRKFFHQPGWFFGGVLSNAAYSGARGIAEERRTALSFRFLAHDGPLMHPHAEQKRGVDRVSASLPGLLDLNNEMQADPAFASIGNWRSPLSISQLNRLKHYIRKGYILGARNKDFFVSLPRTTPEQ
ncbi:MAG: hypothetical protein V1787_01040 [Candidatus Micrarchaeota archaeon]